MRLTIQTDASFDHKLGVGGYGWFINSNRGPLAGEGILPPCESSINGEMMAVVMAVREGIEKDKIRHTDIMLIQMDCEQAIIRFRDKKYCSGKEDTALVKQFRDFIEVYKLGIEFRHVRAHTGVNDARSKSNEVCDLKAKFHLRRARWEHYQNLELET